MLNLVDTIESYTLQAYQNALYLSESLQGCEESSPNKPPFAINYLEYYDSHEPVTSWIIRHIFAYTYEGHHPFFESFARTFLQEIGFKMEWIDNPVIGKNHEYKSIDILVRDKEYAIIIENKLKGADFQLNQLARYIATMRIEGYSDEQIFVVVLPKDNISHECIRDSVWKLPADWQSISQCRKCRIDSYTCRCDYEDYKQKDHCKRCESLKGLFERRTLFVYNELSKWLYNCVVNNAISIPEDELRKQYVLTSAALQFVDFLNSLYQTRENNKYKMDIQKFLSEQLELGEHDIVKQLSLVEDKKKDVDNLSSQLDALYWGKIKEYINEIGNKYHVHLTCEDNKGYYFHCKIDFNGTLVDVILAYDRNVKSDYCQIETKGRRKIPEIIKNDFDILEELNDKDNCNNCIWKYDSYKESLFRFDRILGRLLDLKSRN